MCQEHTWKLGMEYEVRTNRGLAYSRISTVHMTPCIGHAGREKNVDNDHPGIFPLLQLLELQPPFTTTGG